MDTDKLGGKQQSIISWRQVSHFPNSGKISARAADNRYGATRAMNDLGSVVRSSASPPSPFPGNESEVVVENAPRGDVNS